jgi:phosphoglycolate phosphatase
VKAVIFDFDGTLADSFKVMVEVGHQLTHNDILVQPEEVERLRGLKLTEVVKELGIHKYQWPFLLYRGRRLMNRHLGEVEPFSGIDEVLTALQRDGYKLFIMSSNSKSNIESFLTVHGLSGFFDKVYGGVGLLSKAKALRKVLQQNSLDPEDALYVGDEPRDIEAAKHVNVPCVAVGWGFNTTSTLASHAPMVVVRTRSQLLSVLEDWGSGLGS